MNPSPVSFARRHQLLSIVDDNNNTTPYRACWMKANPFPKRLVAKPQTPCRSSPRKGSAGKCSCRLNFVCTGLLSSW